MQNKWPEQFSYAEWLPYPVPREGTFPLIEQHNLHSHGGTASHEAMHAMKGTQTLTRTHTQTAGPSILRGHKPQLGKEKQAHQGRA
jgi:hypothetical protein